MQMMKSFAITLKRAKKNDYQKPKQNYVNKRKNYRTKNGRKTTVWIFQETNGRDCTREGIVSDKWQYMKPLNCVQTNDCR